MKKEFKRKRTFFVPQNCKFCGDKSILIDYKDKELLRQFVYSDGKIRPRRQTGACAKHQRGVTQAVKRARHLALLPFVGEVLR